MKIIGICFIAMLCLAGCKQKSAIAKEFEYQTFKWQDRFHDPERPGTIWMTTLYRTGRNLTGTGEKPSQTTNHCDTIEQLLDLIGSDGWEVVAADHGDYTVKREKNMANGFYVNIEDVSKLQDP